MSNKLQFIDLCILLDDTLIISDVHIGYEEELNKKGIMMPRFSYEETVKRLTKILNKVKPKRIIINGDLKHEFGKISDQEWNETLKLIDFLAKYGELTLIKGNHDKILGPIADKRNIALVEQITIGDTLIIHGDKIVPIPKEIKTIIIGHEHPAITLTEDNRSEKFKCFLKGTYKKKSLIVMPSFNPVTEGTDILEGKLLSPYLKQDLKNFEVYIVNENEILEFGKLKNLIE